MQSISSGGWFPRERCEALVCALVNTCKLINSFFELAGTQPVSDSILYNWWSLTHREKKLNRMKIGIEWFFFMQTILPWVSVEVPCWKSSFLCISNIFCDCWWSTKMAKGLWKSLHPFSFIQSRQTVRKGEQSPFIYVGHFFFFLKLWPICIAFLFIFHTLLHLPNTFLRTILYNVTIQTYVRVTLSFLLPACHWEAFCIVPGLLNCTVSPQLSTSLI